MKNLGKAIAKRKAEAERKNINGLGWEILSSCLAQGNSGNDHKGTTWRDWSCRAEGLSIYGRMESCREGGIDYDSKTLTIYSGSNQVFEAKNFNVVSYIPGSWEALLPAILEKSKLVAQEKEKKERTREQEERKTALREEAKKFGL